MADVNSTRPSRRDRARATRLRIIRAGQQVFTRHGYAGARMIDIAAEAGVAVQTVYFTFHTKAELLVTGARSPMSRPATGGHAAIRPRPPEARSRTAPADCPASTTRRRRAATVDAA